MVSLSKSDNRSIIMNIAKAAAITTLATQAAGTDAPSLAPMAATKLLQNGRMRLDTSRRLAPSMAPGNASLFDAVALMGPAAAVNQTGKGFVSGSSAGGYHAVTAARLNQTHLTHPPAAVPKASAPSGNRKLLGTSMISAPMYGCPRIGYTTNVAVGGQDFWALLDTGSSSFGVASSECTDCNTTGPGYVPGPNAVVTNNQVIANYGVGAWTGPSVIDEITLINGYAAPIAFGAIVDQNVFFHPNTCTYNELQAVNNQAIMGLAGPGQLLNYTTSYFDEVKDELFYPSFTFAMCDANGVFYLGGYPTDKVSGDMIFTAMIPNDGYLSVVMLGLRIGNTDLGIGYNDLGPTIVDTGTTINILPPAVYQAATAQIVAQSGGAVTQAFFDQGNCIPNPVNAKLPPMTFEFYNSAYTDGTHPNTLTQPGLLSYAMVQHDARGNAFLCPMITAVEGLPTLLGASSMRSALVYFDPQDSVIGFGVSKGICS